jgi:large subunit ribosomal protein L24
MTIESSKPKKQRAFRYNADISEKKRLLKVHVSKDLQKKVNRRTVLINKGDKVRLLKGNDKGKTGSVIRVDYDNLKVYVEGIVNKTAKGVEKPRALSPYNLEIVDGNFSTKSRSKILERAKRPQAKTE